MWVQTEPLNFTANRQAWIPEKIAIGFRSLQAVGGDTAAAYPFDNHPAVLGCIEEGKRGGLELNRVVGIRKKTSMISWLAPSWWWVWERGFSSPLLDMAQMCMEYVSCKTWHWTKRWRKHTKSPRGVELAVWTNQVVLLCIITCFFVLFQNFFLPVCICPWRVLTVEIYRKIYLRGEGKWVRNYI